eukprot:gnl/TRDRNA2_/TRDRNA2_122822_c1_seq1.p1 gnl/TRDRNA2_/TRDRNA2_122822_c1~~gnl/TRDRNA2_/TRDRNA2_122822_c1_seq1.p1  ORF type:complete len:421 (+),score=48.17 gnl/TRDRNA2_/TRDRNA2_122822_c1_seq1:58-1320(+)
MIAAATPQILIGTPGRLKDLLENGVAAYCNMLRILIFDEADRLLDSGFRGEIEQILPWLPPTSHRQTFLFSATFPKAVSTLTEDALKPDYAVVDAVGEEAPTNLHVVQYLSIVPPDDLTANLWSHLKQERAQDAKFKAIVFFPTAMVTKFYTELFQKMNFQVLEMHSRRSQQERSETAEQFRNSNGLIMFSSDVSARGMDYPDVTLVIQFSMAWDSTQYTHRLGRTGRAGRPGRGILLLTRFSQQFAREVGRMPLTRLDPVGDKTVDEFQSIVEKPARSVAEKSVTAAYQAFLAFYKSRARSLGYGGAKTKHGNYLVVKEVNSWHASFGFEKTPELEPITVKKMGLEKTPTLRVRGERPIGKSKVDYSSDDDLVQTSHKIVKGIDTAALMFLFALSGTVVSASRVQFAACFVKRDPLLTI